MVRHKNRLVQVRISGADKPKESSLYSTILESIETNFGALGVGSATSSLVISKLSIVSQREATFWVRIDAELLGMLRMALMYMTRYRNSAVVCHVIDVKSR